MFRNIHKDKTNDNIALFFETLLKYSLKNIDIHSLEDI
jgi:hypothetical protein